MSSATLDSESLFHNHCTACVSRKCNITPDNINSCAVIDCEYGCGSRLHQCKSEEHIKICSHVKVPCINRAYGCGLEMTRSKTAAHLKVCPASILRCRYEWNRWPMHSQEENWKAPLPFDNPHVKCGQLDVALALRDQRMLVESFKTPRKRRKVFRNFLTQRYPPVPLTSPSNSAEYDSSNSAETSHTASDDDDEAPWDAMRSPPGLQSTVYNQLQKATKKTADTMAKTIDYAIGRQGLKQLSEMFKKQDEAAEAGAENVTQEAKSLSLQDIPLDKNCSASKDGDRGSKSEASSSEKGNDGTGEKDEFYVYRKKKKLHELLGVDLNIEFISSYQPKPKKMFTFLCAQEYRRDEYAWHIKNTHYDIMTGLNGWFEQRCPLSYLGCTFSFQRFHPNNPNGRVVHSSLLESFGYCPIVSEEDKIQNLDTAEDKSLMEVPSDITLHMSENIRSRLREATPEIYTSNKCDSSVKVFPRYKSFFSREVSPCISSPEDQLTLTSLPFEVVQNIARELDSYSLCNLALTCKHLREVCCSLLDEKGMVSLVWEKLQEGPKYTWNVAYKRWRFSTGYSPIRQWRFQENSSCAIHEHLKVCPYNQEDSKHRETGLVKLFMFDNEPPNKQLPG